MMVHGMRRIFVPMLAAAGLLLIAEQADAQMRYRTGLRTQRGVFARSVVYDEDGMIVRRAGLRRTAPMTMTYIDESRSTYVPTRRGMLMRTDNGTVMMPRRGYSSFYPAETAPLPEAPIRLQVRVPVKDAEVFFGETKTTQTGMLREFISPNVAPNRTYTYEIRARWMENGQPVERTRTVQVKAGQRVMVDLR